MNIEQRPSYSTVQYMYNTKYRAFTKRLSFSIFRNECENNYTVEEKNLGTCHVVEDCSGTSNPKFYFALLLLHPAHGETRPQKTPKIPKKGLKSAQKFLYFTFLKVSPETKFVRYFCLS